MFRPVPLNLPPYAAQIKMINQTVYIFDELRKKNLVLTPEEWVRQHWINYLHTHKKYPKSLMHAEGGIKINGLQKRSDLVLYNADGNKVILAEFKAPSVKITQQTFDQISNYNITHKIPYLIVSNGINHFYCKVNFSTKQVDYLNDIPNYTDLA